MQRLYFLIPDADTAKVLIGALLLARVPERRIHIIAKDYHLLVQSQLPKANLLHESDLVPAIEKGLAAGGIMGLLAGLAAVSFPPAGLVLGGGAIFATTLSGTAFGSVVAPMIGISAKSSLLKPFEVAVENGQLLLLVDVTSDNYEMISQLIMSHYPKVSIQDTEPAIPALP